MIAAIIFTGFMGLVLVLRRRNTLMVGVGVALLLVCALLVHSHLEWLQG